MPYFFIKVGYETDHYTTARHWAGESSSTWDHEVADDYNGLKTHVTDHVSRPVHRVSGSIFQFSIDGHARSRLTEQQVEELHQIVSDGQAKVNGVEREVEALAAKLERIGL